MIAQLVVAQPGRIVNEYRVPLVGNFETFAYTVAVEGDVIGRLAGHCPNVGPG